VETWIWCSSAELRHLNSNCRPCTGLHGSLPGSYISMRFLQSPSHRQRLWVEQQLSWIRSVSKGLQSLLELVDNVLLNHSLPRQVYGITPLGRCVRMLFLCSSIITSLAVTCSTEHNSSKSNIPYLRPSYMIISLLIVIVSPAGSGLELSCSILLHVVRGD